jgi:hypothetical protein
MLPIPMTASWSGTVTPRSRAAQMPSTAARSVADLDATNKIRTLQVFGNEPA